MLPVGSGRLQDLTLEVYEFMREIFVGGRLGEGPPLSTEVFKFMIHPTLPCIDWNGRHVSRARCRSWRPGAVMLLNAVVFVALIMGLSASGSFAGAGGGTMGIDEARTGTLLFKTQEAGRLVEAPRLGSDFDITISGPTARGRLTQHFVNPTDGWVEAVYVFPLPESAAVDTLKMVVGSRVLVGRIEERQQAKIIYERAKRNGQKASLVEQERPNVFTQSVANIGPGEAVVIQLEYQQAVGQNAEQFSLRVPLVVAPRYHPRPIVQTVDFAPGDEAGSPGWVNVLDPVPDRERLSPPVLDPEESPSVNPVTLTVRLEAGFPLGEVKSHHHAIDIDETSDSGRIIRLAAGAESADRDFELTWRGKTVATPAVGLFRETIDGEHYVLAFVTPPVGSAEVSPGAAQKGGATKPRREIVFVIDTSGSMGGTSIVEARNSLLFGLKRLGPEDRFNVIRFSNDYSALFPDSVVASATNVSRAEAFVAGLEAGGGTEMFGPLTEALEDRQASGRDTLRQVVFLTDGAIGNEQQLFEIIAARRGRSRVFMVGIGSAPNSHLMTRAAEIGRGAFTHIGSVEQVGARMRALFEKLENPVVTGLAASFGETKSDATPEHLPDLYKGEPVVLAAQVEELTGDMEITGLIGQQPWTVVLPLARAAEASGISKIWARRKIADAEVGHLVGTLQQDAADDRILHLALQHGLVSRLTSLIAVDETPSRPEGAKLTRAEVPLNLPKGWDFEKVFGPRTGEQRAVLPRDKDAGLSNGRGHIEKALFRQVAQRSTPMPAQQPGAQPTVVLPKTATDAELRLLAGMFLMLLGLFLAVCVQHRRNLQE